MLNLHPTNNKKCWNLIRTNENNEQENIVSLEFINSSIANKIDVIQETLTEMCDMLDGFEKWFLKLLHEYIETDTTQN